MEKTFKDLGTKVDSTKLLDHFPAPEGYIDLVYGRIRNGKSTHAVRLMLDDLDNGIPVYSNLDLDLEKIEFDDRNTFKRILFNFIGFKKRFYSFNRDNFHYVDERKYKDKEQLVAYLLSLTDCSIYWDEGQWLLDSYTGTKFGLDLRLWLLHTGHFNRRIVIITQRPTAIHVTARGNVGRFFKCQVIFRWPLLVLRVQQFQDMLNETVDESKPVSSKLYFDHSDVFRVFNTHFLRHGVKKSQTVNFEAFDLKLSERAKAMWYLMRARFSGRA